MLKFYAVSFIYFLSVIFSLFFTDTAYVYFLLILFTFLYSIIVFFGVSIIRFGFFMPVISSIPQLKGMIALTYDDGPHPIKTPILLDLLKKEGAKASFFLIGNKIEAQTPLVKRMLAEGHSIGNHSYSHTGQFPIQSSSKITAEILLTQQLIESISGKANPYFRPPFGVTNPLIAKAVAKCKLLTIGWNIRSFDTVSKDKERTLKKITSALKGGDIILLHEHTDISYWLTEEIIKFAKDKNLQLVSLDELLSSRK